MSTKRRRSPAKRIVWYPFVWDTTTNEVGPLIKNGAALWVDYSDSPENMQTALLEEVGKRSFLDLLEKTV